MYLGRYINLDRNTERRALIEENLRRVGIADRYQRFPAADGLEAKKTRQTSLAPGALGLWLSHEQIACEHQDGESHLHIVEDDALLPASAAALFEAVLQGADARQPDWDILYTDIGPSIETRAYVALAEHVLRYPQTRQIALVSLDNLDFAGTVSMFINRRSVAKYAQVIADQWKLGSPIDLYLRQQVHAGHLKAYVTAPFVSSISPANAQSDIRETHDFAHAVYDLYRRSFYVEADQEALLAQVKEATRDVRVSTLSSIFLHVQFAAMSDKWQVF